MKKIDKVILQETLFIGVFALVFSVIMQVVFLFLKHWDYTVLLGNILGAAASVLNFFLLGLSVQKATSSGDVKYAKNHMKMSQAARMFFLVVIGVIGAAVSCFNIWATLISLFFPRIALILRPLFFTKAQKTAIKEEKEQEKESDVIEEE